MRNKLNNKTKMFKSKMNGNNVSTESLPGFFEQTFLVCNFHYNANLNVYNITGNSTIPLFGFGTHSI